VPRIIDEELGAILSATEALIPSVSRDMDNPSWERSEARILILRLSPFGDMAGSTSHLVLFAECRKALPRAYIDFGFFPNKQDRAALSSRGLPYFYGIDSGRGPADFDLILVSNSFALELVNLPYLFSDSGIPMRASERADRGDLPIVLLGGSNAICAGALLFPGAEAEEASDCLVDGIFFGEGEGAIGELAVALARPDATRAERLAGAASIEGLWRALSGAPAERKTLLPYPPQLLGYPVLNSSVASTAKLQISAGCPGFCSFCLEGWESRPYRELPVAEIAQAARELKAASGASTLEVYSYNFNTHASVFDLIFELSRIFRRVNFMSQRLDILADSPALASAELAVDKRSFTLGIEGISERMRAFYRKGVDEAQIDDAIARLSLPAVRELKLFYIIAGIEGDEDIVQFAQWASRLAETRKRNASGQRVLVSAGYLVRLPFTPLEYAPLCLDRDKLEGIARRMERASAAAGLEFRLAADFEEYYVDQLLALGGHALAPWLELCPKEGIAYDGGLSNGTGGSLEGFARKAGLLGGGLESEKGEAWRPPLAFADDNHEALRAHYLLSSRFSRKGTRLRVPEPPGAERLQRLERLMEAKRRFASIFVRITIPRGLARATEEYRSAWVMRALFAAGGAEACASVFDAEEALFSKGSWLEGMVDRFWGQSCYRLLGPDGSRLAKAAAAAGFEVIGELPKPLGIDLVMEIPPVYSREAEDALKAWLSQERIRFVEEREGAVRRLTPAPRDAKKRMLLQAELRGSEASASGRFELALSLGSKARLAPWLSRMGSAGAVTIEIAAIHVA
jgi:radical SAM superfamily enzyme YgiQ (UPF0313 family)